MNFLADGRRRRGERRDPQNLRLQAQRARARDGRAHAHVDVPGIRRRRRAGGARRAQQRQELHVVASRDAHRPLARPRVPRHQGEHERDREREREQERRGVRLESRGFVVRKTLVVFWCRVSVASGRDDARGLIYTKPS